MRRRKESEKAHWKDDMEREEETRERREQEDKVDEDFKCSF